MNRLLIIAALLAATSAQAAPTTEQCSAAADLASGAMNWRRAGITEDVAMEYLRKKQIYSGLPVWAIKYAYDAPADVSGWMLKGSVMADCRKREE